MKSEQCIKCAKSKHRTEDEKSTIIKRLNIVEGQINGVKQMVSNDRYCDDVLIQLAAINKSIESIANNILKNHLSTCVADEIKKGNMEIIDEVMNLFGRIK